jgi:hypothetical protein
VEISKTVQDFNRAYHIQNYQAEPYQQHQNFSENCYSTIKNWFGYAKSVGHALTWKHLTKGTKIIIYWLEIRSAKPKLSSSPFGGEMSRFKPPIIFFCSHLDQEIPNGIFSSMPTFDPQDLMVRTFLITPEEDGTGHRDRAKQVAYELDEDNK